MSRAIAIGWPGFVSANLLVTLAYSQLWPFLYDWSIVDWNSEARLWIEISFHGLLAAVIGLFFCIWFARRIKKTTVTRKDSDRNPHQLDPRLKR